MPSIPTPEFVINKRLVSPIEIDMWNIQGKYENGAWHPLVHACVKEWAKKNNFVGKASIWSSVMPSASFETYTNTFYIVAFGMAGFMKLLESTLCDYFPRQVLRSGEMQVKRRTWRPYLHLEYGQIWIIGDDVEWDELV